MWRSLLSWIRPPTPNPDTDGLVLGIVILAVLVISLPFLLGLTLA